MKKFILFTICSMIPLMFSITACSQKVSNDLGSATRTNDTIYDDNYNAAKTDTLLEPFRFDHTEGAGFWDYYGITNGKVKSLRNDLTGTYMTPNTATDGAYQKTQNSNTIASTPNNTSLDSSTVAN